MREDSADGLCFCDRDLSGHFHGMAAETRRQLWNNLCCDKTYGRDITDKRSVYFGVCMLTRFQTCDLSSMIDVPTCRALIMLSVDTLVRVSANSLCAAGHNIVGESA